MSNKIQAVPDAFRWLSPSEFVDIAVELGMTPEEVEKAITPKDDDLQDKNRGERLKNGQKQGFFKRGR